METAPGPDGAVSDSEAQGMSDSEEQGMSDSEEQRRRPMQVTVNGDGHELSAPCSVAELLERLGLPESGVAVARDGIVLPKSGWGDAVRDGDELEVLTAVQGG